MSSQLEDFRMMLSKCNRDSVEMQAVADDARRQADQGHMDWDTFYAILDYQDDIENAGRSIYTDTLV